MTHEEELLISIEQIKENGFEYKQYIIDEKVYNVSEFDYYDFEKICSEPIEDFIRRVKPKDDNELSYLMGLYMNKMLGGK